MQIGAVEQGGVWLVRCAAARGFWPWTGSWGDLKTCRQRMSSLSSRPRDRAIARVHSHLTVHKGRVALLHFVLGREALENLL